MNLLVANIWMNTGGLISTLANGQLHTRFRPNELVEKLCGGVNNPRYSAPALTFCFCPVSKQCIPNNLTCGFIRYISTVFYLHQFVLLPNTLDIVRCQTRRRSHRRAHLDSIGTAGLA